jgi:hypothetical protein
MNLSDVFEERRITMKQFYAILVGIFCLLSAAHESSAALIIGDGTLGDFTGNFSYSSTDGTEAVLDIELTNTSPEGNGGYLTAFAFNIPTGYITDVSFFSSDNDFGLLGNPDFNNGVKGVPYGYFDTGASITGQFLGGGKPSFGIPAGHTEQFTFYLTGTDLHMLTVLSFVNETSAGASPGKGSQFFLARFRGFEDGGSNKTPGELVPIPGAVWLLGSGLIGLVGLRKKFEK